MTARSHTRLVRDHPTGAHAVLARLLCPNASRCETIVGTYQVATRALPIIGPIDACIVSRATQRHQVTRVTNRFSRSRFHPSPNTTDRRLAELVSTIDDRLTTNATDHGGHPRTAPSISPMKTTVTNNGGRYVPVFGTGGWGFESLRVYSLFTRVFVNCATLPKHHLNPVYAQSTRTGRQSVPPLPPEVLASNDCRCSMSA